MEADQKNKVAVRHTLPLVPLSLADQGTPINARIPTRASRLIGSPRTGRILNSVSSGGPRTYGFVCDAELFQLRRQPDHSGKGKTPIFTHKGPWALSNPPRSQRPIVFSPHSVATTFHISEVFPP